MLTPEQLDYIIGTIGVIGAAGFLIEAVVILLFLL